MSSRERYEIGGSDLGDIIRNLNFMLQHIGDRLDKLEGIRGKTDFVGSGLDIEGPVNMTGQVTINGDTYSSSSTIDEAILMSYFLAE